MTLAPTAFVLAGGRSTRMGRDKAQLQWGTTTLLGHALETLRNAGFTPAVLGRVQPGVLSVPDVFPSCGPLGGIHAALRSLAGTAQQKALFLPVDTPLLPAHFLRWMWIRAQAGGAAATVPVLAGKPHPVCAVYSSGLLSTIEEALREGRLKVMDSITSEVIDFIQVEAPAAAEGWVGVERWFANVNTPGEWERLRSAEELGGI